MPTTDTKHATPVQAAEPAAKPKKDLTIVQAIGRIARILAPLTPEQQSQVLKALRELA